MSHTNVSYTINELYELASEYAWETVGNSLEWDSVPRTTPRGCVEIWSRRMSWQEQAIELAKQGMSWRKVARTLGGC